jgi:hypothetical protein
VRLAASSMGAGLPMIISAAERHRSAGLAAVTGKQLRRRALAEELCCVPCHDAAHCPEVNPSIMHFSGPPSEIQSASLLQSVA